MTRLPPTRLGLLALILSFGLAACAAPAPAGWPGLTTDSQMAYVASNQQVYAIDLANGKQAWAFPAAPNNNVGVFFAEPGVSAEVIVAGSDGPTSSHSGVLYGLDPASGQQRWCLAFDAKGAQRQNCPAAPGGNGSGLFGIAAPSDNRIIGGIAITQGVAYLGLANNWVYAVNADSGEVAWSFQTGNAVWATPRVDETSVYVVSLDHFLYALARDTGSLQWKKDLGSAAAGTPAVLDDWLYVGTFGNQLLALDKTSGEERWSMKADNWVWGGPFAHEATVFFADLSGKLFAVDARTGETLWSATPGGAIRASPVLAGDRLYVVDRDGNLFAVNPANGNVEWNQTLKGELLAQPHVVGNLVLAAPLKGENLLEAYDTSGALRWVFLPSK